MGQGIGGVADVKANGEMLRVKGSLNLGTGNEKRTAVTGSTTQGVLGYNVEPGVPYAEGKLVLGDGFDPIALTKLDDATITIALETGQTFTLFNAWYAGEATIDTQEGEFSARFEGRKAKMVSG